jgi:quinoprotein glucose dehydrogenase
MRWKIPFGEFPDLVAKGLNNTGSDNYGGPVVTAGGLVHRATNFDKKFHAYDKLTGKLYGRRLPAAGNATPAVYQAPRSETSSLLVVAARTGTLGECDRGVRAAEMTDQLPAAAAAEAIARLVALAKTRGVSGLLLGVSSTGKTQAAELFARSAGSKMLTIDLSVS